MCSALIKEHIVDRIETNLDHAGGGVGGGGGGGGGGKGRVRSQSSENRR